MKHPWLSLWRALLNVNFGISALRGRIRRRERLWELVLFGGSMTVFAAFLLAVVYLIVQALLVAGIELGEPQFVLTLAHFMAAVVVFFFGVPFVMSSFYFSNDAQLLMVWPLRPKAILSAKFATILVSEYLTVAFLLVPVYVLYARYVSVSAWYLPTAIATFLITPVVPLALAALLVVVLMRAVSGANKREHFAVLGAVLLLVAILSLQYLIQEAPASQEELNEFLFGRVHGLSEYVSKGYPVALWSMLALARAGSMEGFAALAGVAAISLIAVVALMAVGERLFLRAAQSSGAPRAGRSGPALLTGAASAPWSIARVERKVFMRTPMYVFNGLGALLFIPVLALLPAFAQEGAFEVVLQAGRANPLMGLVVIWGWFAVATGLSVMPSTAVSREGARLWVLKSLPVSGKEYFLGKLLGAESVILPAALPGALVFGYIMQVRLGLLVLGTLFGMMTSFFIAMLCLGIDMARPWLTWTDPTRAVKSNVNGLLGMLVTAVVVVVSALIGYLLTARGVAAEGAIGLIALLLAGAVAGFWRLMGPRLDLLHRRAGE